MNFRRLALFVVPVVVMAIGARLIRARQPDVWKANAMPVLLAANGSRIVGLSADSAPARLRVWNTSEHRAMLVQDPTEKKHLFWDLFGVSPHGEWAALLSSDSQSANAFEWLEVWDLRRAPVHRAWRVRCWHVRTLTWVNGRLAILDGTAVKTYDSRGQLLSNVQMVGHAANEVFVPTAISRDGAVVVDGMNLMLYDARSGKMLRRLEKPRPNSDSDIGLFSFSPDGQFLIAEDSSKKTPVRLLWNVKTGRLVHPKKPPSGFWTAQGHGQIQPDGSVEDVVTRQKMTTISLPASGNAVADVQISVDGKVVVVRGVGTVLIQNPR